VGLRGEVGGRRRAAFAAAVVVVLCAGVLASTAFPGSARAGNRPDAWVKLCGPRNTCSTQPWHPWLGDGVYNTTGTGQHVTGGVEEGNMIRFWVLLQNDGVNDDVLKVKACPGTATFPLLSANVGAWRFHTRLVDITSAIKAGTASFPLPKSSAGATAILTLTFRAITLTKGLRYTCPVTVSSTNAPTVKDRVVATLVTI
jgi:hypothetical protein